MSDLITVIESTEVMPSKQTIREHYLKQHGIKTLILDGRINALEEWTVPPSTEIQSKWVDVTDWSFQQIRIWLGY